MSVLKFAPLESVVDPSFWAELGDRKLDSIKLSEESLPIYGYLSPSRYVEVPSRLLVDSSSFDDSTTRQGSHKIVGSLLIFNTLDRFNKHAKAEALQQAGSRVWQDISSGAAESDPSRLSHFLFLTYGDLKQFHFHYWFAFPALKPPAPFSILCPAASLVEALGADAAADVAIACDSWRGVGQQHQPDSGASTGPMMTGQSPAPTSAQQSVRPPAGAVSPVPPPFWLLSAADASLRGATSHPLSAFHQLSSAPSDSNSNAGGTVSTEGSCAVEAAPRRQVALAFADPCHLAGYPGWPLRNLLLLAAVRFGLREVQVVCVREARGCASVERSLVITVQLPTIPTDWPASLWQLPPPADAVATGEAPGAAAVAAPAVAAAAAASAARPALGAPMAPDAVGWEADDKGKLKPRFVDLSVMMDPHALAEQAVDLNLRLMRWRAAPNLQIDRMREAKCLLLGAGTLGCAVARTLLAWGVRNITFVDCSTVSYSNPVRQSLFVFDDCLSGGRPKAAAAAEALTRIFPAVKAESHAVTIPMPGHPPANPAQAESMRQDAAALDRLVSGHDAVFLLTDTRESRWLPALLAAAHGKIAITSAVGFDSFVVMRHGGPPTVTQDAVAASQPTATAVEQNGSPGGLDVSGSGGKDVVPMESSPDGGKPREAAGSGGGADSTCDAACSGSAADVSAAATAAAAAAARRQLASRHERLGCYFCNDVVAPLNSTVGRTLDQQCTVARPGLAPIAGAVAVELLAALLQHPDGVAAPSPSRQAAATAAAAAASSGSRATAAAAPPALGAVPHMVRGNLNGFEQTCMEACAYSQCTACSATVVQQYRADGWEFLLRAIQDPACLEELTGLAALQRSAEAMFASDSEDEEDKAGQAIATEEVQEGTAAAATPAGVEDDWMEL